MSDLYNNNRRCLIIIIIVVVIFLSYVNCSKESSLPSERHPEGVDYDESYSIKVTRGQEVINSTLTQGGHYRAITLTVSAFNSVFVLDLHLNTYLFAVGYIERSFSKEGVVYHNVNHTESHCYYIGKVRDQSQSTAAVSTCKGIVGYFTVGNISYHIDPASDQLNGRHKVYRGRGDANTVYRCGHESVSLNSLLNPERHNRRMKRFIWPQDLDQKNKVVELYIANDHSQYLARGNNVTAVIQRAKEIVNIANAGYQPRGIYLVLVGIEVWDTGDQITVNKSNSSSTLREWATYRMTNITPIHYNDNGVLITANEFDIRNNSFGSLEYVVGLAYLGMMCKNTLSAAFVADVYPLAADAGSTMDHEMGHNFGLDHDDDIPGCVCSAPNRNCIMSTYINSSTPSFTWSECSKDRFAYSFQHGVDICLYNVPQTIGLQPNNTLCGNGIVDNGEQCDCGNSTDQECNKACCNSCQLVPPATCAYGRCCNISTCQLLSCGTLCRAKADLSCDLDEFCDGNNLCSADTHLPDGANCTVNGVAAYCYDGRCRSHQSQCELLWGPGTLVSIDPCFDQLNTRGVFLGNCGIKSYWLPNVTYVPCSASDVMCGLLQCQNLSRSLYYYLEFFTPGEAWYPNGDTCHSVLFDFGLDTQDPGFVPSGAKCGAGKMCVDQQCLNISSLNTTACSSSCQTNEVCNNMGQCQSTIGTCQQSTTRQQSTTAASSPSTASTTKTLTPTSSTTTAATTKTTPTPTTSTPTPTTSTLTTTKTTPIPTTSTPTPTTSTPTTTKTTPIPTTSTPTPTTSTLATTKTAPIPTTSTPTPTTSTPTTTKTTPIPTTSTPTPTTSTPATTKTAPIPTTSTPTPTTSTPTTTKTTPTPTTSTPTPTTSTLTTTKTTPIPTTSTPTPTTSTPMTTKTTPIPTTSIPTPPTSTPTTTKTTPTTTTSTPTPTTSTLTTTKTTPITTPSTPTPTTSTPTTTETTPIPTTSTPTPTTSTPTTTETTPIPTTSTPTPTTSTPTTTKTAPIPTTSTPTPTKSTPTTTKTTTTPTTSTPTPTASTLTTTKTTPTPTTSTPTPTTSTPTTTKTTSISTTSTPIPTTSTPTTKKTTPIPTTSTPTPKTTTMTTQTTPTPTTSTPTPTTSTPTTTKTTPTPTTSTPTPTTSTPTTTKTTPTLTASTPTPTTSTPTTTKTTPIPTASTPTLTTSTQTTTKTTPTSTTSTPTPKTTTMTTTQTTPSPSTSTPTPKTTTLATTKTTPNQATSNTTPTSSSPLTGGSTSTPSATVTTPVMTASTSMSVRSTLITGTKSEISTTTSNSMTNTPSPSTSAPSKSTLTQIVSASTQSISTLTQRVSTLTPGASTLTPGAAGVSTAVLGLVLGALGLVTAIVLPLVCCRIYCPVAFNSWFQLFSGAARTSPRLPLGSGTDQVFTSREALSPVPSRLQWIPAERYLPPRRDVYTMPVQPQTGNLQPELNFLRQPRQTFGRRYRYPRAFYTGSQYYSPTDNMQMPQIVIR